MSIPAELKRQFAEAEQEHVFLHAETLTSAQLVELVDELKSIDLDELKQIFDTTKGARTNQPDTNIQPFPKICHYEENKDKRSGWAELGYGFIGEGKLGMLLLAGGQGTRLGTSDPKGMYNIGLPSEKSLFQLQAERLKRAIEITSRRCKKTVRIPWYIMTSDATDEATRNYFKTNNYFGLNKEDIFFFMQELLPCITPEGKIIMESRTKVARAPNGNGGLYAALAKSGALADMKQRGIELLYQYCVDNSLVVMADPVFTGYCVENNNDCTVKVVAKAHAHEAVGVVCMRNGRAGVLEYSEISKDDAERVNVHTGRLYLNEAHICMNMFKRTFLEEIANEKLSQIPHHVAVKKIPCVNEKGETSTPDKPNGWKLEMFIFDVFEHAKNIAAFEVLREEEFAPLKNKDGPDSPSTCRIGVSELHKKMLHRVGGSVIGDGLFEISPSICCSIEDIKDLEVKVRSNNCFPTPFELK